MNKPIMASQVVEILQKRIEEYGDLPVYLPAKTTTYDDDEYHGDKDDPESAMVVCYGVNTWMADDEVASHLMMIDPGWADALL